MTRLFLVLLLINTLTADAQDMGEIPVSKTAEDFQLKKGAKSIYEITYAAKLENRVLLDSTIKLDTLLFRNKEVNTNFNEAGFVTSLKTDSFDAEAKTILSREHIYYFTEGKLSGIVYKLNGKQVDSTAITYNRKNEVYKQLYYDKKGSLVKQIQYFYRYGNVFNIKVRDEEGMLINFIRFKYDLAGNLKEQEIKNSNMQYVHSYKYRYDTLQDGSRQVNKYDYIGKYKYQSMERYLYDSRNNMTELITTDSRKQVTLNKTVKYNPKGLKRSELIFTRYKNKYDYYYEYEDGSWRTKYVVLNGKLISKTHRVIEHHDTKS